MRRLLTPKSHGILDIVVVVFLSLVPSVFTLGETAASFAYILAGVHLLLSLLTIYPFGVIRLIPFRIHGLIEVLISIFLVFSPYALGFSDDPIGALFFPIFGLVVLLVFLITEYSYPKTKND